MNRCTWFCITASSFSHFQQTNYVHQRLVSHQPVPTVPTPVAAAEAAQVGGGGPPRIGSTKIKIASSRGGLFGKTAPLKEGKTPEGSNASKATSARGTTAATRELAIPASAFSTGCAGGTASFLQQPPERDSDIVTLKAPLQLPPSAWMGSSGSDYGLLPSEWCLSDDDEDDDVEEGVKGDSVQLRFFIDSTCFDGRA